jgi:seryl-tRNA synthetase
MLQVNHLRDNRDLAIERMTKRNFDATELVDKAIALDTDRKSTQADLDNTLANSNKVAKAIGDLFKSGKIEEANVAKAEAGELKKIAGELQDKLAAVQIELQDVLYQLPNIPNEIVPTGKTDQDNEFVRGGGERPDLSAGKLPHWELAKKFNLIDFELGVKITGAGFPLYRGSGARLQRGLINFFLDEARDSGYEEFIPPYVINHASGTGTGQLPDKEGQMYHITADDLYLVPTAEVPLTNIFRNQIVKADDLPHKLTAYSPCFRREAGSYGKDVKGLNRLHQFDKVEIVQVVKPEDSYGVLEAMIVQVESLLKKLGLEYRIVRLCGGDLGFTAALTYDFEVYSAAQEMWLEVSSVSNFETFQANRLKLRYKNEEGKTALVHTLNGSALALPRIMAAILENYQVEDGINVPEVLQSYLGVSKISND